MGDMRELTKEPSSSREQELEAEVSQLRSLLHDVKNHDFRHRAIFEIAVDFAIIAMDRQGNITDWNYGAQRILGWSAQEIRGNPVSVIFMPEDQAEERPSVEMRMALEAGRGNDERWHQRKDGKRFWASGEIMPLHDETGHHLGFLKILRDRTSDKLALEAQRAEAEFMKNVLASSADCIKVLDLNGKLTWMSDSGKRLMEVSDFNAIVGCPWPDFWQDQGRAAANAAVHAARTGGSGRFQGMAKTMAGTAKWWDVQVTPILGADNRPDRLLAVSRDITLSKQAEIRQTALIELGDLLRALNEPDRIAETAGRIVVQTLGVAQAGYAVVYADGDNLLVLKPWRRDASVRSLAGEHRFSDYGQYADRLHHGQIVVVKDIAASELTMGQRDRFEQAGVKAFVNIPLLRHGRMAGVILACDDQNRIWSEEDLAFLHSVADRTWASLEQADTEATLRTLNDTLFHQVEERTRERNRLWETTNDLMGMAGADGFLKSVNPAWTRTLGWTEDELLNRPYYDVIDSADHDATAEVIQQLIEGARINEFVNRICRKDGSQRVVMWNIVSENGLLHIIGRDITALRQAEEQLRQSQKMEAVGQLTGGLAHDFNNLLTGIAGSLELLQVRVGQGRLTGIDRYIAAAQGASSRAAALTHRLLAFSRQQTLDPKPTDVRFLIQGMEELIRRSVGPSIAIEVATASDLWTALIDPSQLENSLLNLCINAKDAMPAGGRLVIEAHNSRLNIKAAQACDLVPGDYLALRVTDTGTGMAPDVVARVFDPFFTTKPIGKGTGLGLSMIYGFARQSGGQVSIRSTVGEGTTMCIYLPRHHGAADTADEVSDLTGAPRAKHGQTVLVVDDEPAIRTLVAEVLEDLGYSVIEAADGFSGVQVVQSDVRIDLLVTDVGLPGGIDGRQVADAARKARSNLQVLFITGYAEDSIVGERQLEPGMHFMNKPFSLEGLVSRIKDLLLQM